MSLGKALILMLVIFTGACTASSPSVQPARSVESHAALSADMPEAQTAPENLTPGLRSVPETQGEASVAGSLCTAEETILFSCAIEAGSKMVSLCASRDVAEEKGYLYYAYGTREVRQLVFPAEKQPPAKHFHRTHLGFAGSTGGYAYSFDNAGYKYIVYSVSGAEGHEDQGVMVTRGDAHKPQAVMPCKAGSVIEDDSDALLDLTLEWDRDTAIDDYGLPARD